MKNVFQKDGIKSHTVFEWESLGDIKEGRGDLGEDMPVLVYRLQQFTMYTILAREYGVDKANDLFRDAGFLAGAEFAKNVLDLTLELGDFLGRLQAVLAHFKIGIFRMEAHDPVTGRFVFTVGEDLDCSGLPITGETVCVYDEGFIAGILKVYTGVDYDVREIDCWSSGNRTCRFTAEVLVR